MSAEAATQAHGHGHGPSEVELHYPVAHHFDDPEQQHEAAVLGMWSFLATEVLFFGGLFTAYVVYRTRYTQQFTLASHHLNVWLGALNTGVLLVSSLFVALAVRDAQLRRHRQVINYLLGTIGLGVVFLLVKAVEWHTDWEEHLVPFLGNWRLGTSDLQSMLAHEVPNEAPELGAFRMFFVLYFFMTGLHGLHLVIGLGILGTVAYKVWKKRETGGYINMVEVTGLYWHFIDIVWVFLYPLLYLIDPGSKAGH
jgi:cytochrome c oxidase subunit 3